MFVVAWHRSSSGGKLAARLSVIWQLPSPSVELQGRRKAFTSKGGELRVVIYIQSGKEAAL